MKNTDTVIIVALIVVMGGIIALAVTRDNGPGGDNDGDTNPEPTTPTVKYSVSISVDGSGTVTGGGSYVTGTNVTVTASPNAPYNFVGWYEAGVLRSSNLSFTFTIEWDKSFTAKFERPSYTIQLATAPGGKVTGSGTYLHGDVATLIATPAYGYEFLGWTDYYGGKISLDETFRMVVTENNTLYPKFGVIHDASITWFPPSPVAPITLVFTAKYDVGISAHGWIIKDFYTNDLLLYNESKYAFTQYINIHTSQTLFVTHYVYYEDGKTDYCEYKVVIG